MCERCKHDGMVINFPLGLTRGQIAEFLGIRRDGVQRMMKEHPIDPISARKVNGRSQYVYQAYEVAEWINHRVGAKLFNKMRARDSFKSRLAHARENQTPDLARLEAEAAKKKAERDKQKAEYLARKGKR